MGEHQLTPSLPPLSLYQMVRKSLVTRVCMLEEVRTQEQHSLGVLQAPAGLITVIFM